MPAKKAPVKKAKKKAVKKTVKKKGVSKVNAATMAKVKKTTTSLKARLDKARREAQHLNEELSSLASDIDDAMGTLGAMHGEAEDAVYATENAAMSLDDAAAAVDTVIEEARNLGR
jgi:uncharacterized coiled-coil DUF342 family protein